MNKEYKTINEDNEKQKPQIIDENKEKLFSSELFNSYNNLLIYSEENNLEGQINCLTNNIYLLLHWLTKMGVEPDYILKQIIKYNYKKTWDYGMKYYNNRGKRLYPSSYNIPFRQIKREIELMQDNNYYGGEDNIDSDYQKIMNFYNEKKLSYNQNPTPLIRERVWDYYCLLSRDVCNIENSIDLTEISCSIVNIIYSNICMFVEMGVNPITYLHEKISSSKAKMR